LTRVITHGGGGEFGGGGKPWDPTIKPKTDRGQKRKPQEGVVKERRGVKVTLTWGRVNTGGLILSKKPKRREEEVTKRGKKRKSGLQVKTGKIKGKEPKYESCIGKR